MFPRFTLRAFFVLSLSIPAWAGESGALNIPLDADDLRTIMGSSGNSQCPGCGIVTNVRRLQTDESGNPSSELEVPYANNDGPGGNVQPSPIFSTDKKLETSASTERKTASGNWRVTVRYDDGSYAVFDQDEKPMVNKGERVRVVSGRVEPF